MKKTFNLILFLFIASTFTFSTILAQDKHTFVGVKKCGMCHKKDDAGKQLSICKDSKHANAFKTLQTAKADSVAEEEGYATKAAETPKCLACHATGYDLDAKMLGKRFKIEDGVQCETCHGAGSNYKKKSIMKDHAKSVANGMTEYKDLAANEVQCKTCHNEKSPTFESFDFETRWTEIAHPVQGKK